MASKLITIRWISIGSLSDWKIIELQIIFYEYWNKNSKIKTSFVRTEGPISAESYLWYDAINIYYSMICQKVCIRDHGNPPNSWVGFGFLRKSAKKRINPRILGFFCGFSDFGLYMIVIPNFNHIFIECSNFKQTKIR